MERRYDIDWLRVIAIGLLILYHICIGFQPWGVFLGFIRNDGTLPGLWTPMSMLNIWRIPLLFFVSGMGLRFALRRRSWQQLLGERARRILLPFLFGMVAIVPLHQFLWQDFYAQALQYRPGPVHLWFLGNIFIYVLLLLPLAMRLISGRESRINAFIGKLMASPAGFIFMAACFALEATLMDPETFATFAMNLHGFLLGMLCFFFGFLMIHVGEACWSLIERSPWYMLGTAATLFLLRALVFELEAPPALMALESLGWIGSVLGFGRRYLNRPGRALAYLTPAAYPVYILHMLFQYLGSYLLFPTALPAALKLILLIIFTFAGCLLTYEILIRRVGFLRPLFGLKKPSAR